MRGRIAMNLWQMQVVLATLLMFASSSVAGAAPSFDCKRPHLNGVESHICGIDELGELDRQIADYYKQGMAEFEPRWRDELKRNQQAWLRERDACSEASARHPDHPGVAFAECVRMMLESRQEELAAALIKGRIGAE